MNRNLGISRSNVLVGVVLAVAIAAGVLAVWKADFTARQGSGLGDDYRYERSEFSKTDPKLLLFDELPAAKIATGFKAARGVAVAGDGRICVAGDRSIRLFAPDGQRLAEIPVDGEPRCVAVGGDGRFFVAFKDRVAVYDPSGKAIATWPSEGDRAIFTSVAVAGDDVLVADAGNRIVLRYDTAGKVIGRIGKADPAHGVLGFLIPSPYFDLLVAGDGMLRVVNPGRLRVEAWTLDGERLLSWGKSSMDADGFPGCCNPINIALTGAGEFVAAEKGMTRVKLFDAQGTFLGFVAGAESFPEHNTLWATTDDRGELDLAVDADGRVLVLDSETAEVRVFTRKPDKQTQPEAPK